MGLWHTCAFPTQYPCVVRQDDDYLYLVMEYLPGGDVMVSTMPSPPHDAYIICFLLTLTRGTHARRVCYLLGKQHAMLCVGEIPSLKHEEL